MIIYNVTVAIDRDVEHDWLAWMREVHIPDVMATGYFEDYLLSKRIDPASGAAVATYDIDYYCASLDRYHAYAKDAAPALQREHTARYEGRFSASRRLLQSVPEQQ